MNNVNNFSLYVCVTIGFIKFIGVQNYNYSSMLIFNVSVLVSLLRVDMKLIESTMQ